MRIFYRTIPDGLDAFFCIRVITAIFLAVVLFGYFTLALPGGPIAFPDDYLKLSHTSLFDPLFWRHKRPFGTLLFYKLCNSDADRIVVAQQLLSAVSWCFLGLAVSLSLRRRAWAIAALLLFPSAALWHQVSGWSYVLLSESLGFSLLAAWYGLLLLCRQYPQPKWFVILAGVTLLFSFTRDSISYLVLALAVLIAAGLWLERKIEPAQRRKWLLWCGLVALVFTIQAVTAHLGKRHVFPMNNIVLQRILPDEDRRDWFADHGAPLGVFRASSLDWSDAWASSHDWAIYRRLEFRPFRDWVWQRSKSTYAHYLLTHPGYTIPTYVQEMDRVFGQAPGYIVKAPSSGLVRAADMLWYTPLLLHPWFLAFLACFAGFYLFCWWRGRVPILPILLGLALLLNGMLIYHADAMEIERHGVLLPVAAACAFFHAVLALAGGSPEPAVSRSNDVTIGAKL